MKQFISKLGYGFINIGLYLALCIWTGLNPLQWYIIIPFLVLGVICILVGDTN